MKIEFVKAGNRTQARKRCTFAALVLHPVADGFMCFGAWDHYQAWKASLDDARPKNS